MPYTFGGAVGSRCNFTSDFASGASGVFTLVTGWFYPTTLTAGRRYWSAGAVVGAEVNAITSEISLHSNNVTDGEWVTSGAGIVVDVWHFIAFALNNSNTGPAVNWRVWIGTAETAPQEITLTNPTPPAGNNTGSTSITFGNTTGNNVSFQGDIADCSLASTSTYGGTTGAFGVAAATAITNDEAAQIYRTWVMPHWYGQPELAIIGRGGLYSYYYWPATLLSGINLWSRAGVNANNIVPTLTSSVISENGSPRPLVMPIRTLTRIGR